MTTRLSQRRLLVVLGMHRSGTSALMRVLNLLGVELGAPLLPPQPDNPTGFWEHADAVALNDRLLAALGSSWDDPQPLPGKWWTSDAARALRGDAVAILRSGLGPAPLVGLKDPRLCRLMPFWLPAFEEAGLEPLFVIAVRDPAAVAASLEARNGIGPWKAHLSWLEHVLGAEESSRGRARVVVDYERTLADWRASAAHIGAGLGLAWPVPPERAAAEIERFLKPERRGVTAGVLHAAHPAYLDWTREAYGLAKSNLVELASLRPKLEASRELIAPLLALETEQQFRR